MTDHEQIDAGLAAARAEGRPIDDRTARIIAANWHGGQTSGLYALASSGAIVADAATYRDTWAEATDDLATLGADDAAYREELAALVAYIEHHGPRGPVAGWSELHW